MTIRILVPIILLCSTLSAGAQSTYILPSKSEWMLNRVDVRFSPAALQFSSAKPLQRKTAVLDLEAIDSTGRHLSPVDRYNIAGFLAENSEWSTADSSFKSKQPILRYFYRNKANAYEISQPGVYLVFNPIIQYQQYREKDNDENVFLNTRGLHARGLIDKKIGFSFYFTENQERTPAYVNRWVNRFQAVPGAGYYKQFKNSITAYDYFEPRASVNWKVARFMDMELGYDRNFIGDGFRSLLLSEFSNNYTFLKIRSRFNSFQYQNIFAELVPFSPRIGDRVLPRKYFRAHYLEYAATKWLHFGLFEGTMPGRSDRLSMRLFNPVIFLPLPRNKNKLQDKSYIGLNAKANLLRQFQLYGQFMIDKLKTSGLSKKSWDNRFGWQAGLKYIDVFGLNNVDLQLETNQVRPYTYAAADSITSYTHYNQPLAHPLGANFREYIAILRAQPLKFLYLQAKLISYTQGLDLTGLNTGSNPFGGFNNRLSDTEVSIGDGDKATALLASLLASCELRQNMFIDLAYTRRNYETVQTGQQNTGFMSIGLRWNMARRDFDF